MKRGLKITLAEVRQTGSDTLLIYCLNHAVQYGGCFHSSEMTMMLALALWGEERRLDELPFKCSKCGSLKVDVRANGPPRDKSNKLDELIQHAWKGK